MEDFCVVTFHSTHLALKFERTAKDMGLDIRLIPVPRQISSSCGLAGKIGENQVEAVIKMCRKNDIEFEHIYKVYKDGSSPKQLV
jgi:hypothetical protein